MFEHFNRCRIRALLRRIDARRAALAEQGILHVARGENFREPQIRRAPDVCERCKFSWCHGKFALPVIEEAKSQRPRHARAAIRRRAPAEADEDSLRTARDCMPDQHAGPECIRAQRRTLVLRDAVQPAGLAHLQDRETLAWQPRVARLDRPADRVLAGDAHPLRAERDRE